MNEGTALVPVVQSGTITIAQTSPADKIRRDRVVTTVCGEVLAKLEVKKQEIKDKILELNKEQSKLADKQKAEYKKAQAAIVKTADLSAGKTLLAALKKFGCQKTKIDVCVSGDYSDPDDNPDGDIPVRGKKATGLELRSNVNYRSTDDVYNHGIVQRVPVDVKDIPEAYKAVCKQRAELAREVSKLTVEQAKVEQEIQKMPNTKMRLEGVIASRDLQDSPEDAEYLNKIREDLRNQMPDNSIVRLALTAGK